jgi:hypothetical protein
MGLDSDRDEGGAQRWRLRCYATDWKPSPKTEPASHCHGSGSGGDFEKRVLNGLLVPDFRRRYVPFSGREVDTDELVHLSYPGYKLVGNSQIHLFLIESG